MSGIMHMEASLATGRWLNEEAAAVAMIEECEGRWCLTVAVADEYACTSHGKRAARAAIRWWDDGPGRSSDLDFWCHGDDASSARMAGRLGFGAAEEHPDGWLRFTRSARG